MRICFLGDSFVNGVGDDTGLGWVGRTCAAARKQGHDMTAYNLGVRGDTSADIAVRWLREAELRLPASHDGRLVFSFGTNDCCPGEDGQPRVPHARGLENAQAILSAATAWRPTLVIGPLPVCDDAATDGRVLDLSQAFGKLCAQLGVPYLDVFPAMTSCDAWRREAASGDGAHPNSDGYAALAGLIGDWAAWRAWFTP
ncbi:MAG: GDSL-type esterase/lipase family protein [Alphaproteobacteria bacterium]